MVQKGQIYFQGLLGSQNVKKFVKKTQFSKHNQKFNRTDTKNLDLNFVMFLSSTVNNYMQVTGTSTG